MNINIILMNINEMLEKLLKYQYTYYISLLFSENKAELVTHYGRGTVLHSGTDQVCVWWGGGHFWHLPPSPPACLKVWFLYHYLPLSTKIRVFFIVVHCGLVKIMQNL